MVESLKENSIENFQQLVQNNAFECGLEFRKLRLFVLFINFVNSEETNIFDPNERQIKDNYMSVIEQIENFKTNKS